MANAFQSLQSLYNLSTPTTEPPPEAIQAPGQTPVQAPVQAPAQPPKDNALAPLQALYQLPLQPVESPAQIRNKEIARRKAETQKSLNEVEEDLRKLKENPMASSFAITTLLNRKSVLESEMKRYEGRPVEVNYAPIEKPKKLNREEQIEASMADIEARGLYKVQGRSLDEIRQQLETTGQVDIGLPSSPLMHQKYVIYKEPVYWNPIGDRITIGLKPVVDWAIKTDKYLKKLQAEDPLMSDNKYQGIDFLRASLMPLTTKLGRRVAEEVAFWLGPWGAAKGIQKGAQLISKTAKGVKAAQAATRSAQIAEAGAQAIDKTKALSKAGATVEKTGKAFTEQRNILKGEADLLYKESNLNFKTTTPSEYKNALDEMKLTTPTAIQEQKIASRALEGETTVETARNTATRLGNEAAKKSGVAQKELLAMQEVVTDARKAMQLKSPGGAKALQKHAQADEVYERYLNTFDKNRDIQALMKQAKSNEAAQKVLHKGFDDPQRFKTWMDTLSSQPKQQGLVRSVKGQAQLRANQKASASLKRSLQKQYVDYHSNKIISATNDGRYISKTDVGEVLNTIRKGVPSRVARQAEKKIAQHFVRFKDVAKTAKMHPAQVSEALYDVKKHALLEKKLGAPKVNDLLRNELSRVTGFKAKVMNPSERSRFRKMFPLEQRKIKPKVLQWKGNLPVRVSENRRTLMNMLGEQGYKNLLEGARKAQFKKNLVGHAARAYVIYYLFDKRLHHAYHAYRISKHTSLYVGGG